MFIKMTTFTLIFSVLLISALVNTFYLHNMKKYFNKKISLPNLMMSLFSPFDLFYENFAFLAPILVVLVLVNNIFKLNMMSCALSAISSLSMFFFSLKPKMYTKMSLYIIMCIMFSILFLNFLSVFSYNFPITSHFGTVFILSVVVWGSFILFESLWNLKYFLSHMIPEGTPIFLTSILFIIELISNIIRPITLSVRLVANILAGHLLLALLSNLVFLMPLMSPFYLLLNSVELFVASSNPTFSAR